MLSRDGFLSFLPRVSPNAPLNASAMFLKNPRCKIDSFCCLRRSASLPSLIPSPSLSSTLLSAILALPFLQLKNADAALPPILLRLDSPSLLSHDGCFFNSSFLSASIMALSKSTSSCSINASALYFALLVSPALKLARILAISFTNNSRFDLSDLADSRDLKPGIFLALDLR